MSGTLPREQGPQPVESAHLYLTMFAASEAAADRPYTCSECGKNFRYSSVLLWHKRAQQQRPPLPLPGLRRALCRSCPAAHVLTHPRWPDALYLQRMLPELSAQQPPRPAPKRAPVALPLPTPLGSAATLVPLALARAAPPLSLARSARVHCASTSAGAPKGHHHQLALLHTLPASLL